MSELEFCMNGMDVIFNQAGTFSQSDVITFFTSNFNF